MSQYPGNFLAGMKLSWCFHSAEGWHRLESPCPVVSGHDLAVAALSSATLLHHVPMCDGYEKGLSSLHEGRWGLTEPDIKQSSMEGSLGWESLKAAFKNGFQQDIKRFLALPAAKAHQGSSSTIQTKSYRVGGNPSCK